MARTHTRPQREKPDGAMRHFRLPALVAVVLLLAAAFAACGSGDFPSVSAQPTAEQERTGEAKAQPTAEPEVIEEPADAMPRFGVFGTAKVEFASVSAGIGHTCGVRRDGSVACWGYGRFWDATPPDGEFASVSTGGFHTCGVRRDGSIECWGTQARGLTTLPGG